MNAPLSGIMPNSVSTGFIPCEGPKTIPVLIDFSLGASFSLDLYAIQAQGFMSCVQTLFLDNSDNDVPLTVFAGGQTHQRLVVPPNAQAYLPILQSNPPSLTFESSSGAALLVQIMNFYLPANVWRTNEGGFNFDSNGNLLVSDPILDATVNNDLVGVETQPTPVTPNDDSGTIASGGTAQVAIAGNANRKRFTISNPDTASETLYMMFGTSSAGQVPLLPGMTWDESGPTVYSGDIYLVAATTGHAYTAYEGT